MYSETEIAEAKRIILERVTEGMSLEAITTGDVDLELPSKQTVYNWLNSAHKNYDALFFDDYARARKLRENVIFEEIIEIADNTADDWTLTDRGWTPNKEVVQRSKVRIEARQWVLARMNSKRFGNKVETTLQGGDVPIKTVDVKKLSDATLEDIASQAVENAD